MAKQKQVKFDAVTTRTLLANAKANHRSPTQEAIVALNTYYATYGIKIKPTK